MKIHKGDKVVVLAGKDRGQEGEVEAVFPESQRVLVRGMNVVKKSQKAGQQTGGRQVRQGGIIDREMPMHVSNVAVVSPTDGKATRVGYRIEADGRKIRICKRTGSAL